MKPIQQLLTLVLCLGFIGALCWWFLIDREGTSTRTLLPEVVARSAADPSSPEPEVHGAAGVREPDREHDPGLRRGVVRSSDGEGIPGVRVRWISLQEEDVTSLASWQRVGFGPPERKWIETKTGTGGYFEFSESPGPELLFGSVVIAVHVGHYPGGIDLPGDLREWPARLEIVLEATRPIRVRVVDPSGSPVNGATVHHAARPRRPDPAERPVQIHERYFAQEAVSDVDGIATLTSFRDEQVLWAEKGELVSTPWQGVRPSSIVLTLGESFTIGGTITFFGAPGPEALEEKQRILAFGLTGNLWRPLAIVSEAQQGEWGPLRVPLDGVSRCRVRLEGASVIPMEEAFDRPRPSSHRRIDFDARLGVDLVLSVVDESQKPISTAHAEGWWDLAEFPRLRVTKEATPDGVIRLGPFPPGVIRCRVEAPGYATEEFEGELLQANSTGVTLQKGGGVSGRCLHAGEPVADFEVIYWKAGTVHIYRNKLFFGREDGRFEIESLAPGDWSFQGASPVFPCGKPLVVGVRAEGSTEVVLELPDAIRGAGRVVAADTGQPVSNARIQTYSSTGLARSFPWGPAVFTGVDGAFDVAAFTPGNNYLTVEAEGYASIEVEATATDRDLLDWGAIHLARPQPLQISLRGIEFLHGLEPESFRAGTQQGYILAEKGFDGDGVVRFEEVPPGDHRLIVFHPDGSWARLQLRLDAGEDWRFELKVGGDRRLDVHVVDAKGQPMSFPIRVFSSAQETGGFILRQDVREDGYASFQGIRSSRVHVFVLDPHDNKVATRDVDFGSDSSKSIEIRVGEKPFRVNVVDADGAPLGGAHVTIRSASGIEIHGSNDTQADGWADLFGLPPGPLLMDVQHGLAGRRFGVPIEASAKELEFVLEASGQLQLELVDGDHPLAGVTTRIETSAGLTLGDARQTDEQGLVRYELLGEGTYHLACRRADCWPTFVDEELALDERALLRVQMRRLADLELTVFGPEGLPVVGVSVEIISREFDMPVESWIREGLVRAPSALTTDQHGMIRVEGLPRGIYDWAASLEGEPATGAFELTPGEKNKTSILLAR